MTNYFGTTPADIRKRVSDNHAELSQRFLVWQNQVDIWHSMEFPPKPPKETKNSTGNMSNSTYVSIFIRASQVTYVNRMDRAEPYIEVALEETGDQPDNSQARKGAHVERWCYGVLNAADQKAVRQVKATSMKRQLYSTSGNPGKIVQFLHMRQKANGQADPVWEIIDPYNCYHDFDQSNFRFVREYYQSSATVRADYEGLGLKDDELYTDGINILNEKDKKTTEKEREVHVVNHWVVLDRDGDNPEVWETWLVDDTLLFHRKTAFKRLPYQIFVTNASPRTYQNISRGTATGAGTSSVVPDQRILLHAQPFWAPLEPTMEQFAEGMSLLMKAVALMVNHPFKHMSREGNAVIGNAAMVTPGKEITLSTEDSEDVELLDVIRQVPDALSVLNYLIQDMDRIVPSATFWQTAVSGESGYLYDKRSRDAALVAFADPARACSVALQMGLTELLEQFRESNMQIKLSAIDTNGDSAGKLWYRNFKSSDIPESFVMAVRVAPDLPDDDAKAAQIASMLIQAGVMSPQTAMSKILGIKDPIAELARIKQGKVANLEPMVLIDAVESLQREAEDNRLRAADTDKPQFKRLYLFNAARLDEWRMAFEEQLGTGPQPSAPAKQLNGPSPDVLPPEEYANPDDAAAIMGEVSSSTAGRPPSKNGASKNGSKAK